MNAAEKAKELVDKFLPIVDCGENRYTTKVQESNAKQCAKICVEEIIKGLSEYDERTEQYLKEEKGIDFTSYELQNMDSSFRYWNSVLNEIEKL